MGFKVSEDAKVRRYETNEVPDVTGHLHELLDELIAQAAKSGGGEARVVVERSDGSKSTVRLTLCDFTDEELCEHCEGTGISTEVKRYFCSCGAALTAEEYLTHYLELGHDRGLVTGAGG